jgi:hypothetical protein
MTNTITAQALFASSLQPSDHPTLEQATLSAVATLTRQGGPDACAALWATAYGDHPDTAPARMRWALALAERIEPVFAHAAA